MAQVETLQSTIVDTLPAFLPLAEAALVTGLDVETLHNWISQGKVIAGTLPGGEIAVAVRDGKVVMLENGLTNGQATGNGEHEHEGDVFELNVQLSRIKRENFKHLEGHPITVSEAHQRYKVSRNTILAWVNLYPHVVKVLVPSKGRGSRMFLDEASIAYLAAIHKTRKAFGVRSGVPLVDEKGHPYLIKHPSLSRVRRRKALEQAG